MSPLDQEFEQMIKSLHTKVTNNAEVTYDELYSLNETVSNLMMEKEDWDSSGCEWESSGC